MDGGSASSASLDDVADERLLSTGPVTVRRRVRWGECDPAQVVYTPRFSDYLAAAFSWFTRIILSDKLIAKDGTRLATPMKALSLEFHHTLRPDELFDMAVYVEAVRERAFDLLIVAQSPSGEPRFIGRLTPIAIDSSFRSVVLPGPVEEALFTYRKSWRSPADTPA
nr:acyl-CoA thioesterase [Sphingomonas sp. Y57]